MDPIPQNSDKLRRVLNTPLLTLYGLGVTVGAGIYVLVGATAAQAGPFTPISFLIAAFVVAFTAFSYAELSTRLPVSAGEAAYVEEGFRSGRAATLVGLAVAVSGMVSAAAVAIGAASYLSAMTQASPELLIAIIVAVVGLIAIWGIAQSVAVAAVITAIEISGLVFVIAWGFFVAEPDGVTLSSMVQPTSGSHWAGIGAASLLAFFAFIGFEDMANVAEEVKDPVQTMPKAILWTLALATILYVFTTAAVLVAVPIEKLAHSPAPLALVFDMAPEAVKRGFSFVAIVATLNGVLIQTIMSSRVIYGLADRGHLPLLMAKVSDRTKTPVVATLAVVLIIAVLALSVPITSLAEHTSQIVLLVFVLVNISLIRIKMARTSVGVFFQVPMAVPVLGVITSVLLFATSFL